MKRITPQCPHCENFGELELVSLQSSEGQLGQVGRCRVCAWAPYLGGFLRRTTQGYKFERPAQLLVKRGSR